MTTQTNEAADRLRDNLRRNVGWPDELRADLDAALATERRNVVAEIRRRWDVDPGYARLNTLLDELEGEDR